MAKNKKCALVLTGGGVRGAFQVGALLYLMTEGDKTFDIITGTSVGALNGSFLAQFKKEAKEEAILELQKIWLAICNRKIRKHWFPFSYLHSLWKQSLFNSKPLEDLIEEKLDAEKVKNSGVLLRILATSLDSGICREFRENDKDIKNAVKASAAFPVFFKPVKIEEFGQMHAFVDGGVREVAPLSSAIKLGAEHITIINTGPLDIKQVDSNGLNAIKIALRSIDIQGAEVVKNDLEDFLRINKMLADGTLLDPSKRIIDYTYIGPDKDLVEDPLDFNPEKIREMISKGYDTAKLVLSKKKNN